MAIISKCRYFRCPKCGKVREKKDHLSGWESAVELYRDAMSISMMGSRTCPCGKVMMAGDIYYGVYDNTVLRRLLNFFPLKRLSGGDTA